MNFLKWITAIKAIIQIIKDLLAQAAPPPGATSTSSPAHAIAHSNACVDLAAIEKELADIEAAHATPAGAQAAFGDRIKALIALLMKLFGGLGGLLG